MSRKQLIGLNLFVALAAFWLGYSTANMRSDKVTFVDRPEFGRLLNETKHGETNTVRINDELTSTTTRTRIIVLYDMFSPRPLLGQPARQFFICSEPAEPDQP